MRQNKIHQQLSEWEICASNLEPYYPKVRDRDDVSISKCLKTGALFTSTTDHMEITHYREHDEMNFPASKTREQDLAVSYDDNVRRKKLILDLVKGKKWLDVGTGNGGILDLLRHDVSKVVAIEPKDFVKTMLEKEGYEIYIESKDVPYNDIDVVTLFHVLEHLTTPLETLVELKSKMKEGGKIVIEVPHAKDFLITVLGLESFKAFTFWSEHLVLHTRKTIEEYLKRAGFKNIRVSGFQRYPLANHLYWIIKKKPGGHKHWSWLNVEPINFIYSLFLKMINRTDTLIAIAEK